jgi:thiosulfate reductase cytochrome b subunit
MHAGVQGHVCKLDQKYAELFVFELVLSHWEQHYLLGLTINPSANNNNWGQLLGTARPHHVCNWSIKLSMGTTNL